jgi:LysR family transcriptional regulator, nod-box dependent transcriptional activator
VRSVLEQIRTTIAIAPEFDPETCDRQIRIMASDYSTEVLLTDALAELEQTAPLMRFEILGMASAPVDMLERGMIDLLLTVDFALSSDHPSEIVFHDDYVVVGDRNNTTLHGEISRELYFDLGHVTTRFGKARIPAFEDWFLRRQKQSRRIEVIAPTFLSLPGLLMGTNRIATMHRKLAMRLCGYLPLVMKEVPFEIPPIREGIQWHLANKNDFAIQWTIGQLRTVALNLYGKAGGSSEPGFHERIGVEFQADQHGKAS